MKKLLFYFIVLAITFIFANNIALANTIVKGTFESANYEYIDVSDDKTEKRLKDITISNAQGRTMTLAIDQFAKLTVDNRPTIIDAFKKGMEIEVHIDLRRVKEMHGKSTAHPATISYGDRIVTGTVTRIQSNSLQIKLDNGHTQNYTLTNNTRFFRENVNVSLGELYEGDRVKLTFVNATTNTASAVEIMAEGVKIEYLYKGKLHRIDRTNSKLIVNDVYAYNDWSWDRYWGWNLNSNNNWVWDWNWYFSRNSSTFPYSKKTPIYIGNQRLSENQYDLYKDSDVYFVTVKKFKDEIVERIVIKDNYERSYYEPLTYVDIRNKTFNLANLRNTKYHDGTIMINNGRLVDENSLRNRNGTALVITDGQQSSQYANVMYITNEGLESPNLRNHNLYYGRIASGNNYNIRLDNAVKLTNHSWSNAGNINLFYSNDTVAYRDDVDPNNSNVLTKARIDIKNNFSSELNRYGYFYVIDNKVISAHVTSVSSPQAQIISTGSYQSYGQFNNNLGYQTMGVHSVSRWNGTYWNDVNLPNQFDIRQATFIRDGKVINRGDIKIGDQIYFVYESTNSKVRFIFVK